MEQRVALKIYIEKRMHSLKSLKSKLSRRVYLEFRPVTPPAFGTVGIRSS